MKFATAGRSGRLVRTVFVHSNDPAQPRLAVSVEGTVEVLAGFEPAQLSLREVVTGGTVTQRVKLVGKKLPELKLGKVTSDRPGELGARLLREAGGPVLVVTLRAPKQPGSFAGSITLEAGLDHPLRLPVWASVTGDVQVVPRYVMLSPYDAQRPQTTTVRVASSSGRPFAIRAVKDPTGAVEGKATRQGKDWQVTLRLTREPAQPRGTIAMETNRADQPRVEVIYVVNRAGGGVQRGGQLVRPRMLRAIVPPRQGSATKK